MMDRQQVDEVTDRMTEEIDAGNLQGARDAAKSVCDAFGVPIHDDSCVRMIATASGLVASGMVEPVKANTAIREAMRFGYNLGRASLAWKAEGDSDA